MWPVPTNHMEIKFGAFMVHVNYNRFCILVRNMLLSICMKTNKIISVRDANCSWQCKGINQDPCLHKYVKPHRTKIKTVWFLSAQESTYSARISHLPSLSKEMTPFVCYTACLAQQRVLHSLVFLKTVCMFIRRVRETREQPQGQEMAFSPAKPPRAPAELWSQISSSGLGFLTRT